MRRKKRKLLLILALVSGALLLLLILVAPVLEKLAVTQAENTMSSLVNRIVDSQIADGTLDYDRIVTLEKSSDGSVTALKTNMIEVNRLKTRILSAMDQEIADVSVGEMGVPLGSILCPGLLSGKGVRIPVRILSVNNSDANFENHFSSAGINQTLHQITLQLVSNLTVLTPAGIVKTTVSTDVVVAETVIVGAVPDSYLNLSGT